MYFVNPKFSVLLYKQHVQLSLKNRERCFFLGTACHVAWRTVWPPTVSWHAHMLKLFRFLCTIFFIIIGLNPQCFPWFLMSCECKVAPPHCSIVQGCFCDPLCDPGYHLSSCWRFGSAWFGSLAVFRRCFPWGKKTLTCMNTDYSLRCCLHMQFTLKRSHLTESSAGGSNRSSGSREVTSVTQMASDCT